MDKLEKLAQQIFNECEADGEPVTMEEAMEMASMELGAKEIKNYTQSAEKKLERTRKPKTVKISDEKMALFQSILTNLENCPLVKSENVQILKGNKLISVQIGEKIFKIDLIEQRPSKK